MKIILRIIGTLVACYLLLMAVVYFGQSYAIFHPVQLAKNYQFRFDAAFDEYTLFTPDGEQLNLLYFKSPQQPSKGLVLYFHGNADNLQRWGKYNKIFLGSGYDFMVWDYRSYGKSTGKPTADNMRSDTDLVYQFANKKYNSSQIIIYGRSLGTGLATYAAARHDVARLILETPYYSLEDVAKTYAPILPYGSLLRYEFPTYRLLPEVKCPVTIFHGTADELLPFVSTVKLQNLLKKGDEFIVIEGGKHHNLGDYEQYRSHLRAILR
ncbi:alpha/beta hydrolase [Rhodoflexus caldus]|uniref:alpha/beta hydrolase n=1 Tax=Rhodoflexus caldus TaxID=2891236 RepID=UPI00202A6005|nr:alpha/beta hydrolase [Rhodoflexus caldus]